MSTNEAKTETGGSAAVAGSAAAGGYEHEYQRRLAKLPPHLSGPILIGASQALAAGVPLAEVQRKTERLLDKIEPLV